MKAIYTPGGQLLGFLDIAACVPLVEGGCVIGYCVSPGKQVLSPFVYNKEELPETSPFYRLRFVYLRYHNKIKAWGRVDEHTLSFLVTSEPIPAWVWESGYAIKFESFERR